MKRRTLKFYIALILSYGFVTFARADDTAQVMGFIHGKQLQLSPEAKQKLSTDSISLLASCAYMDAKPKWDAPTGPKNISDVQKQSHLDVVFSYPVKVEVPIEKVTLQVREMMISLPLTTAGIWVRSGDGVQYFAMFDPAVCENLQKQLDSN
jgi:hypothetical protein